MGDGTYMKVGVDMNGKLIYRNDRYKDLPVGIGSQGVGSMILAFDNIAQRWFVSSEC